MYPLHVTTSHHQHIRTDVINFTSKTAADIAAAAFAEKLMQGGPYYYVIKLY